jgi:transposase
MHYKDHQDRYQIMMLSYDSMISQDNPVRLLDVMCRNFVESNLDLFFEKGKNKKGRKAYSPVSLLNLLVYGYFNGISTSRKLEKESHRNIELIWLIEGLQPDHWTISEFRKENGEAIKSFLRTFRRFLKDMSYISTERIIFDGTKVKAYASKDMLTQSGILKKLDNIENSLSEYFKTMEQFDTLEDKGEKLKKEIEELQNNIDKKETEKKRLIAINEKLAQQGLKRIAVNDPEAVLLKGRNGKFAGYNFQIGVEAQNHFIMADYLTTEVNDRKQLEECVKQTVFQTGIKPKEAVADKGYGNFKDILSLQAQQVECFVPLQKTENDKKEEEGLIFTYDESEDRYTCPQGKFLVLISRNIKSADSIYNKYQCKDCTGCPIRIQCTTSKYGRAIKRNIEQEKIDAYKKKLKEQRALDAIKERKNTVEHPFGTIKVLMGKFELILCGKDKAIIELDLYTLAYNLKRLGNIQDLEILINQTKKYNWRAA